MPCSPTGWFERPCASSPVVFGGWVRFDFLFFLAFPSTQGEPLRSLCGPFTLFRESAHQVLDLDEADFPSRDHSVLSFQQGVTALEFQAGSADFGRFSCRFLPGCVCPVRVPGWCSLGRAPVQSALGVAPSWQCRDLPGSSRPEGASWQCMQRAGP